MRLRVLFACGLAACGGSSVNPAEGPCEDYCRLVMRNCAGPNAQYSAIDNCLETCSPMTVGDPAVHTGNNIECRTFWAAIAEGDPGACRKAGPGGDGQCGANCESFCAGTLAICADDPGLPYHSAAECASACAGFAVDPPFTANVTMGNSLACRIYHMTAASTDPQVHCPHTGVVSDTCF
jgi:hypothetical protein